MLKEIQHGHVKTETHNGVTTIEFYHPQSNSLPGKLLEELAHAIHRAGNEDDTIWEKFLYTFVLCLQRMEQCLFVPF